MMEAVDDPTFFSFHNLTQATHQNKFLPNISTGFEWFLELFGHK